MNAKNITRQLTTGFIRASGAYRYFNYTPMGSFEAGDLFLVGYPKSGNSWLQHLMTGVCYEVSMAEVSNRLVRELTPDIHLSAFYKRFREQGCFKSHHLPRREYRHVIYIVRDGRDAVNSYYHMLTGQGRQPELDSLIREGRHLFPSKWHEHVRQWLENPYGSRIHFVRYEDLHADPLWELRAICAFAGLERSENFLQQVIDHCGFRAMRTKEESALWDKNESWQADKYFVRKGEVGDYRKHIPEELVAYFEKESAAELRHFNYL